MHIAAVVLHILSLDFHHRLLHTFLRQILNQRLVFWKTLVGTVEQQCAFFKHLVVVACHHALRVGEQLGDEAALCFIHTLHIWLEVVEHLVFTSCHRTRDDKRCTGIVDKHGVNLIHDGEVVWTLHHFLWCHTHVVAKVVKTKFAVRTESDVAVVCVAAFL